MKFKNEGRTIDLNSGKRLAGWVMVNGYSVRGVAIASGISQGLLSDVVNGRKGLSLPTAAKICQAFPQLDFVWLITGVGKP